jgi:hypothetical protein
VNLTTRDLLLDAIQAYADEWMDPKLRSTLLRASPAKIALTNALDNHEEGVAQSIKAKVEALTRYEPGTGYTDSLDTPYAKMWGDKDGDYIEREAALEVIK